MLYMIVLLIFYYFSLKQDIVEEYDGNQMMDSVNKDIKGESSKENGKKKERKGKKGKKRKR